MGVLRRLFLLPLGAGKEGTIPKTYLLLDCPCHCEDLHFVQEEGKRKLVPLQKLFRNEMRERTQGSGSFFFLLSACFYLCEGVCTCMHTCTREQRKLRLTILQTLHVGGVFSKRTLHHARDVREGAGHTHSLGTTCGYTLESKVGQPGGCPREAREPAKGGALLGKPGGAHMQWDSQSGVWYQWYIYMFHNRTHEGGHMREGLYQNRNHLPCMCVCSHACTLEREEKACPPASLGCGRVIKMTTVLHSRHVREKASQEICSPVHCVHMSKWDCVCSPWPGLHVTVPQTCWNEKVCLHACSHMYL